ncbi:MAG: DUF177 domain-containing protein [Hyphomicrobiales bacterium]|nr:DUF177 domain-containing protein [Hyphomicrobiales bacterium]
MTTAPHDIPFSRSFAMSELRNLKRPVLLDAKPSECAALAAAFGIVAIRDLTADLKISRQAALGWLVTGSVHAKVTQTCVVSLEPFETAIDEPVEARFVESGDPRRGHHAMDTDVIATGPELDPPDIIEGGRLDLGVLAAEFLALALDPWPRKPGVEFKDHDDEPAKPSPFAGLSEKLARRKSKE